MVDIGVVGAGAAAAAATYVIDGAHPDARVTVLEKSGGLCGRAATRRRGERIYDYGANYLTDEDERVVELITEELSTHGLVEIEEPTYTLDADGSVSPGHPPRGRRWSYRRGLTQIGKRLFGRTDATIHPNTPVCGIARDDGQWWLTDGEGLTHGPFDVIVLNPPAPQTASLLDGADWDDSARETLVEVASDIPFRPVFTAILGYEFELDRPYYALVDPAQNHPIGWLARESCKPGHVPVGESLLIVQASGWWSRKQAGKSPDENVDTLGTHVASVLEDKRLADPAWTDHQAWRYALPEDGAPGGPLQSAEAAGLYCTGDWVSGEARLHAALRNGIDVGERIVHAT